MKYSIYNSIIKLSDNIVLLYNSFSDNFFLLNKTIEPKLREPIEIKKTDLKLYRKLVCKNVYIYDQIDEFSRLKQFAYAKLTDEKNFFLIVNPTMDCNLQCWYCYEKHLKSCMTKDIYNRVLLLIDRTIKTGISSFTLGFFGGEPLLEYQSVVLPLIKYTHDKCFRNKKEFQFTFTTNGTLLNSNIIDELCKWGNPTFQITIDGDENMHNKTRYFKNGKGTYSIILQNIKSLIAHNCKTTLRINYTKETIETIWKALDDFNSLFQINKELLTINFHRVWQDKDDNAILLSVKHLVNKLVKQGFRVRYNELNEIKNACYADKKNTAVINYNGDIFKCTARDFTTKKQRRLLRKRRNHCMGKRSAA